jgi:hypothetical protein
MAGNWTNEEKTEILKAFTVLATIQKTYGREIDTKATLQAWEYILGEYPANRVLKAMQLYMRQSSDIPSPADLIALMEAPKPKITQAEFIHAKEQWKLEGFPSYSYYAVMVRDYEKQQGEERSASAPIDDPKVLEIVKSSVKRIGS